MNHKVTVEINTNGQFLEFRTEPVDLPVMDIELALDSKGVARGFGIYDDKGQDELVFQDRMKNEISSIYEIQLRYYNISKGLFG